MPIELHLLKQTAKIYGSLVSYARTVIRDARWTFDHLNSVVQPERVN